MKRLNLMAARIQAGYPSQSSLVEALNSDGYDISIHEYSNIESGRNKEVGLGVALVISKKLELQEEIGTLFLPLPTYFLRQSTGAEI